MGWLKSSRQTASSFPSQMSVAYGAPATSGSFVAMPSQYGAVGGYGGYGGYGYSTPMYTCTPYGAYQTYGGTPMYGGMSAGNPFLDHMPMGYLGVGDAPTKTTTGTTRGVKPKKTRSVTLKK